MTILYCSECGCELEESATFCSNCGSRVDDDSSTKNNLMLTENINIAGIVKRAESSLLIKGILAIAIIEAISFSFAWLSVSFSFRIVPLLFNILAILGILICPSIIGYLSQESLLFVLGYTVLMAIVVFIVHFIFAPLGFMSLFSFVFMLVVMCIMAFIGKFIQLNYNLLFGR